MVPGVEISRSLRRVREVGRGLEGPVASWRFENLFWLDPASGRVMASRQQPLPSAPVLTLNVIRSAPPPGTRRNRRRCALASDCT